MEKGVREGYPDEPERRKSDQQIAQPAEPDQERGGHYLKMPAVFNSRKGENDDL
jgi:hypothetical protein